MSMQIQSEELSLKFVKDIPIEELKSIFEKIKSLSDVDAPLSKWLATSGNERAAAPHAGVAFKKGATTFAAVISLVDIDLLWSIEKQANLSQEDQLAAVSSKLKDLVSRLGDYGKFSGINFKRTFLPPKDVMTKVFLSHVAKTKSDVSFELSDEAIISGKNVEIRHALSKSKDDAASSKIDLHSHVFYFPKPRVSFDLETVESVLISFVEAVSSAKVESKFFG